MFVLTGSNQFYLQEGVSESLAGRTAVINMSGLTQMEKRQIKGHLFDVDFERLLTRQSRISDLYQPVSNVFETIFVPLFTNLFRPDNVFETIFLLCFPTFLLIVFTFFLITFK